tara:strand:- start:68 stop:322 length:255 start_codon:yes stop_codon:yes gene_type:complete
MANVINLNNHIKNKYDEQLITKIKLCKIRDDIEKKLNNYSIIENNELAVSLSSGRYAAMKLTKLIGKEDTIQFFQDCIETANKV